MGLRYKAEILCLWIWVCGWAATAETLLHVWESVQRACRHLLSCLNWGSRIYLTLGLKPYSNNNCLYRLFYIQSSVSEVMKPQNDNLYIYSKEIDFWRRSARISRKDKIRNAIIKQKMNVTRSVLDDIKTKQLKWYGHVQRMEEERLPKKVMKWSPPGRRKWGRPKATWAEGITGLLGEKGLIRENWNDRDKWRKKII